MALWRRNDERRIEARLRSERPAPPTHLVERISRMAAPRPSRRLSFALAAAVTVGLVAMLGAFGGIGYAGSTVKEVTGVVQVVKSAFGVGKVQQTRASDKAEAPSSARSQYEEKVTICHVPPGNPNNPQTLTLSQSGAAAHLRNHPGDSTGACANSKHGGGRR
jgi:hypothetical protein